MFIVYVYNREGNLVAQIEDLTGLEIKAVMSDTSTAQFSIFHDNPYADGDILKKMNRVIIAQLIGNTETELFRGIIRGLEISLEEIQVMCNDKIRLLENRIIHKDYEIENQTLQSVLTTMRDEINTVSSIPLEFEAYASEKITKKFNKKTSFYSIIKEFAGKGYEFRLFGDTLVFGKAIGRDRTTGDLFLEYSYDIETPDGNNIISATMTDNADDITNGILDEDDNFTQDDDSVDEYGLLEDGVRLEGQTATEYLSENKEGTKTYEIEGKAGTFFEVEIGDVVKVYINRNNGLLNYDGAMEVVEKNYQGGDLPKITYKFSTEKKMDNDFFSKLKMMADNITALQIQTGIK